MPQPISNAIIGTGHCLGATGSLTAVALIAIAVTAVAVALLVWNGMFLYSYAQKSLTHLLWVIPATLLFIGIDMIFVRAIAKSTERASNFLFEQACQHVDGMRLHYHRIWHAESRVP